jgi:hypothetical protein
MRPACCVPLLACLSLALSCGRQTALSTDTNSNRQELPFERPPQTTGISPSHSFVPSATRIPEGTAVTISLEHSLSSAYAHSNDHFTAVLDDPIVIDGQTVAPGGAIVTGRVLDSKSARGPHDPGYLRITLTTLSVGGKPLPIATSSLFAKSGAHKDRDSAIPSPASGITTPAEGTPLAREMVLVPGRRLTFRLTQNLDLP